MQTRVFELAASYGYSSLRKLAKAMRVDVSTLSRVQAGKVTINQVFITGALRAFPDKSLNDLFYIETEPERAIA